MKTNNDTPTPETTKIECHNNPLVVYQHHFNRWLGTYPTSGIEELVLYTMIHHGHANPSTENHVVENPKLTKYNRQEDYILSLLKKAQDPENDYYPNRYQEEVLNKTNNYSEILTRYRKARRVVHKLLEELKLLGEVEKPPIVEKIYEEIKHGLIIQKMNYKSKELDAEFEKKSIAEEYDNWLAKKVERLNQDLENIRKRRRDYMSSFRINATQLKQIKEFFNIT